MTCDQGHEQSWADQRFGCFECGLRKVQTFSLRHGMRGDMRDYREDLARFPCDPEALVDGPRALSKLKDKRKREGWEFQKERQTEPSIKKRTSDEIVREAVQRAKAKGCVPDGGFE